MLRVHQHHVRDGVRVGQHERDAALAARLRLVDLQRRLVAAARREELEELAHRRRVEDRLEREHLVPQVVALLAQHVEEELAQAPPHEVDAQVERIVEGRHEALGQRRLVPPRVAVDAVATPEGE
eukprot:2059654-Prymnesium_polylepis.1